MNVIPFFNGDPSAFAPRAVRDAPNFPVSSSSLWRDVTSTLKTFAGMTTPPMSKADTFAYKNGFNISPDVMHSIIASGPSAAMWGDISGIL